MHTLNINLLIIDVWYKITYYEVSIDELKDIYIYIYKTHYNRPTLINEYSIVHR